MEMLLFMITGLLTNWTILCHSDKKELLVGYINRIKSAAGKMLWLPYTSP